MEEQFRLFVALIFFIFPLPFFSFFLFFFIFSRALLGGDAPQVSVVGSLIMAISSRFDRPSFPPRHFLAPSLHRSSNGSRVARFWKELKEIHTPPPPPLLGRPPPFSHYHNQTRRMQGRCTRGYVDDGLPLVWSLLSLFSFCRCFTTTLFVPTRGGIGE